MDAAAVPASRAADRQGVRRTVTSDLQDEVERLRAENQRLRALLGLDGRESEGHRQAWSPTLLPVAPAEDEPKRIDGSSPAAEKLVLARSLFCSRTDVYAVRWENESSGKSGWSPAARGGWCKSRRGTRDLLPLTDEVLIRHFRGEATIGVYPLVPGDTCALLACDFDKGTWALDALAYLDVCHAHGVPAALERSRSGDGAHVWIFVDGLVAAATARALGAALLRQAMAARAELDLNSYDRLFPSQDFLPKAGFGNLIALPLQGEAVKRGATVFLDPTTMEPWSDQWAFLASVARMAPDAVEGLAEALRPVDAGPTLSFAELAASITSADGPNVPPVIRARMGSMLSIERRGLPPAVAAGLKHLASVPNPEFYEKQRMRFSTWDTPRFVTAYREDLEWLHLPRGLRDRVEVLLAELDSTLEVEDDRADLAPIELAFEGELRSQQSAAVADLVGHELGVLVAPPGAGKTVMACAVMAHHRMPTLVIVDRKELVDQWRSRLASHLSLAPSQIGQLGGGRSKRTGVVDIAMIQSLSRLADPSLFGDYGLVVVDECHHLPAVSFSACAERAMTRRWLGLTATPYRRDKLEALISFHCGPTRHEIKPGTVQGTELVRRELVVHETASDVDDEAAAHIQQVFAALVDDDRRTEQIAHDVHRATTEGRTCLVLTQRKDHVDRLATELRKLGADPQVLVGGLGKKARAAVSDEVSQRDPAAGFVIVATGSYLGEGFDWPELDTLFLAFPIAFKGRVVQYVGRLLRAHDAKVHVELHDYVDVAIPVLDRMHAKRLPAFKSLGFDAPRRQRGPVRVAGKLAVIPDPPTEGPF